MFFLFKLLENVKPAGSRRSAMKSSRHTELSQQSEPFLSFLLLHALPTRLLESRITSGVADGGDAPRPLEGQTPSGIKG
jgi:hypothetical protein